MDCYACDQEATQRCSRCGNPYCRDHGDDPSQGGQPFCADCLDPVNAAPSGAVFRASLFALLVASVLGLWLLVRPPSLPGESSEAVKPRSTTPTMATPSAAPASPMGSPKPSLSPSPQPSATP